MSTRYLMGVIAAAVVTTMSAQRRIARLMDVSAFGLAAGRKPANGRSPFPSAFLARNKTPRF